MNLLISRGTDPYHNLATEEYLLKNTSEDYIFLYVNKPCVVVGKHQNTPKEIDSNFTFQHNILISRRLSGGGAVYHDEGNLNFSFIQTVPFGENISYQNITKSIYAFLKRLVPTITLSDRNDFLIDGYKISGSAMHVYKNRVLAHCTLLIDCDLSKLSSSLRGNQARYKDRSIASVRSKVANLSQVIENITVQTILIQYSKHIKEDNLNVRSHILPESANDPIRHLAFTKYATPEWIYGYSPKYTYTSSITFDGKIIDYRLEVEKGIIEKLIFESKDELTTFISLKINSLIGAPHNIIALTERLNTDDPSSIDHALLCSLF